MPTVEINGVYPLQITEELVYEAVELKYSFLKGPIARQEAADELLAGELSSVVLVELLIHEPDERFDVGAFGQSKKGMHKLASDDQVAYDEAFLSDDGTTITTDIPKASGSTKLRFVFWLHYFQPAMPIITCYGPVQCPSLTPMPERLSNLIKYDPVD